jgi:hypothetical protein
MDPPIPVPILRIDSNAVQRNNTICQIRFVQSDQAQHLRKNAGSFGSGVQLSHQWMQCTIGLVLQIDPNRLDVCVQID